MTVKFTPGKVIVVTQLCVMNHGVTRFYHRGSAPADPRQANRVWEYKNRREIRRGTCTVSMMQGSWNQISIRTKMSPRPIIIDDSPGRRVGEYLERREHKNRAGADYSVRMRSIDTAYVNVRGPGNPDRVQHPSIA
jgi:hypothetical protein